MKNSVDATHIEIARLTVLVVVYTKAYSGSKLLYSNSGEIAMYRGHASAFVDSFWHAQAYSKANSALYKSSIETARR